MLTNDLEKLYFSSIKTGCFVHALVILYSVFSFQSEHFWMMLLWFTQKEYIPIQLKSNDPPHISIVVKIPEYLHKVALSSFSYFMIWVKTFQYQRKLTGNNWKLEKRNSTYLNSLKYKTYCHSFLLIQSVKSLTSIRRTSYNFVKNVLLKVLFLTF